MSASNKPFTANDFKLSNASPENIAKLNEALAYLNQSETARKVLGEMVTNGATIRFTSQLDGDKFHPDASQERAEYTAVMARTAGDKGSFPANTVEWNPDAMLLYTNAQHSKDITKMDLYGDDKHVRELGYLSPALLLIHEAGHTIDTQYQAHFGDRSDKRYENGTERFAGEKVENKVAQELGEGIRENHGGQYVLLPQGVSPSLHTIRDDPSKYLKWQVQDLGGSLVATSGSFFKNALNPKDRNHNIDNTPPNLGGYDAPSSTYTLNNAQLKLDPSKHSLAGLKVLGQGDLVVPQGLQLEVNGEFKVKFGDEVKQIHGPAHIDTMQNQLRITEPKATQQPTASIDSNEHLAKLFESTIFTAKQHDAQVNQVAVHHPQLRDSLNFYYAVKAQLPEIATQRVGENLTQAIRNNQALQIDAAQIAVVDNTQMTTPVREREFA